MDLNVKTIRDTISPDLARMIRACKEPRRALEAMGAALVSLTVRAFREESFWLARWAEAGAKVGWHGAIKGDMVALKTSPI